MEKIPTLFLRSDVEPSRVVEEVTPGCEWVLAGEGYATRKWDGTNIRVTIRRARDAQGLVLKDHTSIGIEKRRNPSREDRARGAEPGYVTAHRSDPADKHIFAAVDATDFSLWPDGLWPCEAVGPKIQGGVESDQPMLVPFSVPGWAIAQREGGLASRSFESLASYLSPGHFEGLVFHHPDGRMAKIKGRDFGHARRRA